MLSTIFSDLGLTGGGGGGVGGGHGRGGLCGILGDSNGRTLPPVEVFTPDLSASRSRMFPSESVRQ